MGGTFDNLHRGHKVLLEKAFESGKIVLIGVTSDDFARRQGKNLDHDYPTRVDKLKEFLKSNFPNRSFKIAAIDDYFGPEIISPNVEALASSEETASRVNIANTQRIAKNSLFIFPPLSMLFFFATLLMPPHSYFSLLAAIQLQSGAYRQN